MNHIGSCEISLSSPSRSWQHKYTRGKVVESSLLELFSAYFIYLHQDVSKNHFCDTFDSVLYFEACQYQRCCDSGVVHSRMWTGSLKTVSQPYTTSLVFDTVKSNNFAILRNKLLLKSSKVKVSLTLNYHENFIASSVYKCWLSFTRKCWKKLCNWAAIKIENVLLVLVIIIKTITFLIPSYYLSIKQ